MHPHLARLKSHEVQVGPEVQGDIHNLTGRCGDLSLFPGSVLTFSTLTPYEGTGTHVSFLILNTKQDPPFVFCLTSHH